MAVPPADSTPPPQPPPGRAYEVLTPGEKFGDYQILRCLTYDLMGSLYHVRKARAKETRTLFVLPPLVQNDAQYRERFFRNTAQLFQLDHPNLLRAQDSDRIKGRYSIFHESFEGQNLADYLEQYAIEQHKAQRPATNNEELLEDLPVGLPQTEVRDILRQVLAGLSYAHEHKILHLNLNPTNILRAPDGTIKLSELGLMTIAGKELFEALVSAGIPPISLGPRRIRINTVDILSPEARLGNPGDERSDIYAFGITAYWLLTGQKPGYRYVPPSELNPDLDKVWDTLLANCLERDPAKRYASAQAVLKDLEQLNSIKQRSEPLDPGTSQLRSVFRHMDFIPVPKRIQSRGARTTRAFRLCLIGLVAVVAVGLASMFYNFAFSKNHAPGAEGIVIRASGDSPPRLSLKISPPDALIEIPATQDRFLVRNGQLDLNATNGIYRIVASAPHHKTQSQLVEVTREPQTLNFDLEPALADIEIQTTPGTHVTAIDDSNRVYDLGVADANGRLRASSLLKAGNYTLRLEKENYMTRILEAFNLEESSPNRLDYTLAPIPGTLRVRSTPTGATIYVEEKEIGQTNATIEGLPVSEEFIVTLEKPGYRTAKLAVTLAPNTRTVLDFGPLIQRSGEILPQVTFDGKAPTPKLLEGLVYHLGDDQTFPGTASLLSDIPEGYVTLTASHPDYYEVQQELKLYDNTVVRLPLDLKPRPGTVVLNVQPEGLPLKITNADGKSYELERRRRFSLPADTTYQLTLEAPNYIAQQRELSLKPNETVTWNATLTRIHGPVKDLAYNLPYLNIDLAWIPAGSFTMGSPVEEHARLPVEGPQTQVTLTHGFWLSATEITQEQYQAVTGDNPSEFEALHHPVENVTWSEAVNYCAAVNAREKAAGRLPEGYVYRLPTEAEWEYAARAGAATPFHWGHTADISKGNFRGKYPRDFTSSQLEDSEFYGTANVGSYQPNAFGLYDVHGNVAEWCLDTYTGRLPGDEQTDWVSTASGTRHVVRGGGWQDYAIRSRLASRANMSADTRSDTIGFRLCLGPELKP